MRSVIDWRICGAYVAVCRSVNGGVIHVLNLTAWFQCGVGDRTLRMSVRDMQMIR